MTLYPRITPVFPNGGSGGGGGPSIATYANYAALPAPAGADALGYLETTGDVWIDSSTAGEWVPYSWHEQNIVPDVWLDPAVGLENAAGGFPADGEKIARWQDRQGNWDLVQATDANRPTYRTAGGPSGGARIDLTSGAGWLDDAAPTDVLGGANGALVGCVSQPGAGGVSFRPYLHIRDGAGAGDTRMMLIRDLFGGFAAYSQQGSRVAADVTNTITGTGWGPAVWGKEEWVADPVNQVAQNLGQSTGANSQIMSLGLYVQGNPFATAGNYSGADNAIRFGFSFGGFNAWNGSFCSLILLARNPTMEERKAVRQYLAGRFGV